MNGRKERRERLVGALLPYYLERNRVHQGGELEEYARRDAYDEADRVMDDSDRREAQDKRQTAEDVKAQKP